MDAIDPAIGGYMSATSSISDLIYLRLSLTGKQKTLLRRAAKAANKPVAEFVLKSALRAAEQSLLDRGLILASGKQYREFLELLDRPEREHRGLQELFSRRVPWGDG